MSDPKHSTANATVGPGAATRKGALLSKSLTEL